MPLDFSSYNERVKAWGAQSVQDMKALGQQQGIQHRANSPSPKASLPAIKDAYRQADGAINKISFKFSRDLIWTQKGAGKGRGGTKGSSWVDKYGKSHKTDANSFGKMGTGGRVAKPFINPVLSGESGVEELATICAEETGDIITSNILI